MTHFTYALCKDLKHGWLSQPSMRFHEIFVANYNDVIWFQKLTHIIYSLIKFEGNISNFVAFIDVMLMGTWTSEGAIITKSLILEGSNNDELLCH